MNLIDQINSEQLNSLNTNVPAFEAGDTLRVHVKVTEGERTRIQVYEGICIARKNDGINSNFTVRKLSFGEGVERVFPLYGPMLDKIEVKRRGVVRRAKLYYLRGLTGKAARIAEKLDFSGKNSKKAEKEESASPAPEAKPEAEAQSAASA